MSRKRSRASELAARPVEGVGTGYFALATGGWHTNRLDLVSCNKYVKCNNAPCRLRQAKGSSNLRRGVLGGLLAVVAGLTTPRNAPRGAFDLVCLCAIVKSCLPTYCPTAWPARRSPAGIGDLAGLEALIATLRAENAKLRAMIAVRGSQTWNVSSD
jgi:hypothetical protein